MYVPAEYDLRSRRNLRGKSVDSVSFYDYDGNLMETYLLIEQDMLEQDIICRSLSVMGGKILAFYVHERTDELHTVEIQTGRKCWKRFMRDIRKNSHVG